MQRAITADVHYNSVVNIRDKENVFMQKQLFNYIIYLQVLKRMLTYKSTIKYSNKVW